MELNREQIIKALEWCIDEWDCEKCPIGDASSCHIETKSLALIKELIEENERLKKTNEYYSELEQGCYVTGVKNVTADTVRQMQLKMAMRYGTYTDKDMTPITEVFRVLDQIAKEMLEG